ncbi:hypothetical protein CYMTET_33871 [Cymbomonas tetramitiformis]|uniref:Uncharacterized protein n=1 Tax=Cymbomonas tetramitiformis TaxID=36881 RepID=A0AAE0KQF9_9CHLO|nr:hypothetical protein CYMTET_33871 [Cymbomonas tetramitiformis]
MRNIDSAHRISAPKLRHCPIAHQQRATASSRNSRGDEGLPHTEPSDSAELVDDEGPLQFIMNAVMEIFSPAKDNAPEHWPVTPYSGRIPTKTEKERMRHLEIAVQDLTTSASDASSIAELPDSSQQDASFAENIALGVASIFTPAQVDEDAFKGIAVGWSGDVPSKKAMKKLKKLEHVIKTVPDKSE